MTITLRLNDQVVEGAPVDAASVVLVRDGANGLEVFMLRRGSSTTVMNAAYVFPGGKVDLSDASDEAVASLGLRAPAAQMLGEVDTESRRAQALFVAACRETFEETGVQIKASDLIPLSRWITPKVPAMMRRRFDTRFFVACLPQDASALHDGQEADASAWYSPRQAMMLGHEGKIALAPPQLMTLAGIARHASFAQLRQSMANHVPRLVEPFAIHSEGMRIVAYPGDPRHPVQERAMPGPTALVYRGERFEPEAGFEAYFD
jgi:8-oxo-dGTP pyrophosphatase MutT (NUDIX family)